METIVKHSFLKPAVLAIGYVDARPVTFWLNAVLIAVWLYLLWPLFDPVYVNPIYVVYLTILTLPALGYAYLALIGGRQINIGLLIACVFGFAIGETYLRLSFPAPEQRQSAPIAANGQHPYYMFTGVPNSSGQMVPQQGGANDADNIYRLNSLGFRIERPLIKLKPEGELRIFVLGGSTVFQGAPLAKTIPAQIEAVLRSSFSGAKVYNFGIVSAVSGQELALLTHLLVDYAPDVVISYGGGNDIHSPYQYDPRPGFPLDFVRLQVGTQVLASKLDLRSALASQLFRSRVIAQIFAPRVQEIRLPMAALRTAVGYRTPEWESAIIETYSNNLHRMCRLGRAFNFTFYAVLQPLNLSEITVVRDRGETKIRRCGLRLLHAAPVRPDSRCFPPTAGRRRDGGNLPFCRFVADFRKRPAKSFWDFIHVNNDGNATVAAAIATDLANSLRGRLEHAFNLD